MLIPVIMAGGVGSRLWPLSRDHYPKQFIPLLGGEHSLLQLTCKRLNALQGVEAPILLCNEDHRFLAAEQLRQVGINQAAILLEPAAKNTAPAIALGALEALKRDPDAVMLVCPSDHHIPSQVDFQRAVSAASGPAAEGKLVTFGIVPTRPETGYGYIKASQLADKDLGIVEQFVEKPDIDTATQYLASGNYYWNGGIFMFRASQYLQELQNFAPDIYEACHAAFELSQDDLDFRRIDSAAFMSCRAESIDYAVMEQTTNAMVVPLQTQWNDLGAWDAIWETSDQDSSGNATQGDVLLEQSNNNYIRAESRLVAGVGLNDLVVIETDDSVLVSHKNQVQEVKRIVAALKEKQRSETLHHTRVYRPWGSYESIVAAPRFQAKRIIVKPGAALSLQLHHHRAEHWVVVKGRARVTRDEEVLQLNEDESTYIPVGMKHRLENPGKIPLEIIEVQTGSYLGEDDIERFEDQYGR